LQFEIEYPLLKKEGYKMAKQEWKRSSRKLMAALPQPEKPVEDLFLSVWRIGDKPLRGKRICHIVEAANADFTGRYLEEKKTQLETPGEKQLTKFMTLLKSLHQN
jgi:hypothetical protein